MKRGLKKILGYFPQCVQEFFEMILSGAAEYHIKVSKSGRQKYRSYTQLKRHQKNVRRFVAAVFLVLASLIVGVLLGPVFFPQPAESEVYIPNGKGDILVGNVSRNQATVIFKTLDGANGNVPLATTAVVEFYEDENYTDLARRSRENDYAVTHIVPVDSLQEGKIYYIKIIAKDSATPAHSNVVSSWGDGHDPIKVFTTGELIPNCAESKKNEDGFVVVESMLALSSDIESETAESLSASPGLQIESVQNENYLQPGNKVQSIISWVTNVPASTMITYGEEKSGEKKQLTISNDMVIKHAAILTTLKTGSVYYFTVESKDADGNIAKSEEYSLRTPRQQENVIQKITNNFKGLLRQIKPR
ncbi:MAG: hypothetical protein ACD_9C00336G0006 [uncultured bacterium]|nr:MAG: hypothetical protein ACD_9C00336G0006 [uncultured bacterium]